METTFATVGIRFEADSTRAGNMLALATDSVGAIKVAGVEFGKKSRKLEIFAQGKGQVDVRLDNPEGELLASTYIDNPTIKPTTTKTFFVPEGQHNVVFLLGGETLRVDGWQMK